MLHTGKWKGHTAVLAANLIFGLHVPISKLLLGQWMTPLGFTSTRIFFAAALFWFIGCFCKKETVQLKDMGTIALAGVFGFVLSQFLFALSLKYTTPIHCALIVAMTPVAVMLMAAVFLREPVTSKKTLGVILSILGALLIVLRAEDHSANAPNDLLGIFFEFLAVVTCAVYLIMIRNISSVYSPLTLTKWMFLFAAILMIPVGWIELPSQPVYTVEVPQEALIALGYVLLFSTAFGFFLIPYGLKFLRATTVSVYMNLQPVVAALAAICIGQDLWTWDKPVAAVLVITGAYIVAKSRSKDDPSPEKPAH